MKVVVATGSPGVQEVVHFQGKPCVMLREKTGWVEVVQSGCNWLVRAQLQSITEALRDSRSRIAYAAPLYGDRSAADAILGMLGDGSSAD